MSIISTERPELTTEQKQRQVLAEALVTLTNTAVPDALPTEFPFELTSNQDGTITVGDPV